MKMSDIEDLINAAIEKDYSLANDKFAEVMSGKISGALEQEKMAVANSIYGENIEDHDTELENEEDLEDDIELDDEDIEDHLEED